MQRTKQVLVLVGVIALVALAGSLPVVAQKTLAATMNVHVFPADGQTPEQQSTSEAECYNWAVENTGIDPFDLAKQAEAQQQQAEQAKADAAASTKGAGAKGAVGGAAAGAVVGKVVSDDAGKGAAIGAAAGGLGNRRRAKKGAGQATQEIDQQAQQAQAATKEQSENFKKSFAVCLEAKKYMVKF